MCSVLRFFKTEDARKLSIVEPRSILAPVFTSLSAFMKSCVPHTTPPTVSLDPLMNLVKLCMTISAPSFLGVIESGEKVLSTTNCKSYFFANAERAFISATSYNGLLTLSQYNTLVFSLIAASTVAKLVMFTKEVLIPNLGVKFFKNAYVPP